MTRPTGSKASAAATDLPSKGPTTGGARRRKRGTVVVHDEDVSSSDSNIDQEMEAFIASRTRSARPTRALRNVVNQVEDASAPDGTFNTKHQQPTEPQTKEQGIPKTGTQRLATAGRRKRKRPNPDEETPSEAATARSPRKRPKGGIRPKAEPDLERDTVKEGSGNPSPEPPMPTSYPDPFKEEHVPPLQGTCNFASADSGFRNSPSGSVTNHQQYRPPPAYGGPPSDAILVPRSPFDTRHSRGYSLTPLDTSFLYGQPVGVPPPAAMTEAFPQAFIAMTQVQPPISRDRKKSIKSKKQHSKATGEDRSHQTPGEEKDCSALPVDTQSSVPLSTNRKQPQDNLNVQKVAEDRPVVASAPQDILRNTADSSVPENGAPPATTSNNTRQKDYHIQKTQAPQLSSADQTVSAEFTKTRQQRIGPKAFERQPDAKISHAKRAPAKPRKRGRKPAGTKVSAHSTTQNRTKGGMVASPTARVSPPPRNTLALQSEVAAGANQKDVGQDHRQRRDHSRANLPLPRIESPAVLPPASVPGGANTQEIPTSVSHPAKGFIPSPPSPSKLMTTPGNPLPQPSTLHVAKYVPIDPSMFGYGDSHLLIEDAERRWFEDSIRQLDQQYDREIGKLRKGIRDRIEFLGDGKE